MLAAHLVAIFLPGAVTTLLSSAGRLIAIEVTGLALGLTALWGLVVLGFRRLTLRGESTWLDWTVMALLLATVVGSGIMGSGIAEVAAKAGVEVLLRSRQQQTADAMVASLGKSLDKQVERGKLDANERDQVLSRVTGILANVSADFHNRLVQLWFDLLFQNNFAVGENLLDMRTQFARLGIDDLQLFLNTEGENVIGMPRPRRSFFQIRWWLVRRRRSIHGVEC